jgi:hypothetical protein
MGLFSTVGNTTTSHRREQGIRWGLKQHWGVEAQATQAEEEADATIAMAAGMAPDTAMAAGGSTRRPSSGSDLKKI